MKLRIHLAAALFSCIAVIATAQSASAQSQQTGMVRNAAPAPQGAPVEELPAGKMPADQIPGGSESQEYYPMGQGDASYSPNGGYPGGCANANCCGAACEQTCGAPSCCEPSCGEPSCCSQACCVGADGWWGFGGGQFYFTADYLHVRASFSQATAFIRESLADGTDEYVPIDFDSESSYRFGGGYRLCCCGEQVRFQFTRMTSSGDAPAAQPGDIVPYETSPAPNGETQIRADVATKAFDLEWAKTIPLGGQCCNSCADTCGNGCQTGCCDTCCGKYCPAWDITWSGGVRIADADWSRTYERHDDTDFIDKISRPELEFRGAGLRTGLEGRRYFGRDGWFSLYAKGNISLLVGNVEVESTEQVFDPTTPNNPPITTSQTFKTRQIIPVTELEAGVTSQVTCHTAFTAGYLMAAWHDLGFRDESSNLIVPGTTVFEPPTSYDDANILGFDGFFARLEIAY
jgi:hypothetical protein